MHGSTDIVSRVLVGMAIVAGREAEDGFLCDMLWLH
jgi:hypothetical protein